MVETASLLILRVIDTLGSKFCIPPGEERVLQEGCHGRSGKSLCPNCSPLNLRVHAFTVVFRTRDPMGNRASKIKQQEEK